MTKKLLADPAHCDHEHRQAVATTKQVNRPMNTLQPGVISTEVPAVYVVCLDCGKAEEASL